MKAKRTVMRLCVYWLYRQAAIERRIRYNPLTGSFEYVEGSFR